MKFNTQQLLNELYSETEQTLLTAISDWQNLPESKLLAQPPAGGWSAAQCLYHLNSYGRYYLPEMDKAISQRPTTASAFFEPGFFGNYFYKLMLPVPGKKLKKMKAPKDHQPSANPDAHQTLAEFIDQSERLLAIIEKARRTNLNTIKVPISISRFIKLKLGDTLRFVTAHNLRHVQQAQRALEATVSFSAGEPKRESTII